ncbi:protein fem-1 homolog B-like [Saccostrea cucullata]|uniref:protein fem-1 homolog B-like n=1 Tax=Saccostrea cuccullata TaxID=36930 RepID=UPI002ED16AED
MSSQENSVEDKNVLKQKVYAAARDGRAISLFAVLWNLNQELVDEVLHSHTSENGQITTPVIIASRNGEEKVVSVLLSKFKINLEQTGTVKFDGFVLEGATALWCAAGAGHLGIVKLLLEHGADVNHATKTNSTPLRAACFDGRLDVVQCLVENGADISIPNKYNNTCLMITSYKGHSEVVRYLLEKGANPDSTAHCGATAMHFAAECGHIEVVQDLVRFNGKQIPNDYRMTPILVAAECGQSALVEFLATKVETKEEKINAFELLGASFANDKEHYDVMKAFLYLREAMHLRYSDPDNIITKGDYPCVDAYNSRIECKTLGELNAIKYDFEALHMESLAIRERILGPDNPDVPHPIIFRGAVFADNKRFDRCILLWLHAMKLRHTNKRSIAKDLLRFAQVFSQMLHIEEEVNFSSVQEVFKYAMAELTNDKERITNCEDDGDSLIEIHQTNIHTCLYLLVIILKTKHSPSELEGLYPLVYHFLKLNPFLKNNYTPLHMAVDGSTYVDDFHVNDVVSFPDSQVAHLLIKCGARVNAQDSRGNTPLHALVSQNSVVDTRKVHNTMNILIDNNAHLDICNNERKTAIDCAQREEDAGILRASDHLSLKCIAARCVCSNGIDYQGLIPPYLEEFLAVH